MTRKTKHKKEDLFQRRQVRDLSEPGDRSKRSFRGMHPLHTAGSVLLTMLGLFGVFMVMMNMVTHDWLAPLLSLSGSVAVLVGAWILFEAAKERKSVDNLVRRAIMRSLRDKN